MYSEIKSGCDGLIHRAARAVLKGCCSGCVVRVGIFKAMQVAVGLALQCPVAISLGRVEEQYLWLDAARARLEPPVGRVCLQAA